MILIVHEQDLLLTVGIGRSGRLGSALTFGGSLEVDGLPGVLGGLANTWGTVSGTRLVWSPVQSDLIFVESELHIQINVIVCLV